MLPVGTPLRGVCFSPDPLLPPINRTRFPTTTVIPRVFRPVGISCLDFQVSEISLNIEKSKRFNVNRCVAVNYPSAGDCHVATLLAKTCLLIAPADSHRRRRCRSPLPRRCPMSVPTALTAVHLRRDAPMWASAVPIPSQPNVTRTSFPTTTVIPRGFRPVGISCLDFQVAEISLNIEKSKRFNVNRCVAVNYPSAGDCHVAYAPRNDSFVDGPCGFASVRVLSLPFAARAPT